MSTARVLNEKREVASNIRHHVTQLNLALRDAQKLGLSVLIEDKEAYWDEDTDEFGLSEKSQLKVEHIRTVVSENY